MTIFVTGWRRYHRKWMEICCHGARQGLSDSLYFLYGRKNELWTVQNIFLLLQICPKAGVCCRPCNPSKWEADIWGWHLRMTWGQEVCYALLHCKPAFVLGLPTVWSHWGDLGMARCWEMSTLPAGYIPRRKVTSASSSGSLGFIVCVKCCM